MASDINLLKVKPPAPVLVLRDFGKPMLLWGPVKCPKFVIDKAELPY